MFSNYKNHPKAHEEEISKAIEAHEDTAKYLTYLMGYGSMDSTDVLSYYKDYKTAINFDIQNSAESAFKLFKKVNPVPNNFYYPNNNTQMPNTGKFDRYGYESKHKNSSELLALATKIARVEAYLDYHITTTSADVANYEKERDIENIMWDIRHGTKEDLRINYNPETETASVSMVEPKYKYSRPPVAFNVGDNWYESVAKAGIAKVDFKGRQAWVYEAEVLEEAELDTTYRVKFAQVYGTKEQKDLAFRHGYAKEEEYRKLFHKDEAYLVIDNTDPTVHACGTSLTRTQTTLRGRLIKKMMGNLKV